MWIPVCKANSPVYVSITSLDSHNVIYCCKFSCSDWFFCTFPIKHFLVSDLPWSMVSVLEPELIFSGVFSLGFFAACPSTQLAVALQWAMCFLEAGWAKASGMAAWAFAIIWPNLLEPISTLLWCFLGTLGMYSRDSCCPSCLSGQCHAQTTCVCSWPRGSVFVHNQGLSVLAQAGLTAQQAPACSCDAEQSHLWLGDTVTCLEVLSSFGCEISLNGFPVWLLVNKLL